MRPIVPLAIIVSTVAIAVFTNSARAVVSQARGQRGEQQAAAGQPARGATAPPPITWPSPALPAGPIVLDTGIQHQIRLFVTKGLNQPWSMAFLPSKN